MLTVNHAREFPQLNPEYHSELKTAKGLFLYHNLTYVTKDEDVGTTA